MSVQQNKSLVRRILDFPNTGDLSQVDELIHKNFVYHSSAGDEYHGPDGFRRLITTYRQAFPDLEMIGEDLIAEGDEVAVLITCRGTHRGALREIAPTQQKVEFPVFSRAKFQDGKLVDLYEVFDNLAILQQLGVIETQGERPSIGVPPSPEERPQPRV